MFNLFKYKTCLQGWYGALALAAGLLFFSCKNKELDPLPFFQVVTDSRSTATVGSIQLIGRITDLGNTPVDSCGFIWYTSEAGQTTLTPGQRIYLPPPAPETPFSTDFQAPQTDKTYYFRAFAVMGPRKMYGTLLTYNLDELVALAGIKTAVSNDSAVVWGRITGLQVLRAIAEEHGFVYSATNTLPTVGGADCKAENLKQAALDTAFTATLTGLNFNTKYYARAYMKAGGRLFYSKKTDVFEVKDGWRRLPNFGPYQLGAATVTGGKAYMGFGVPGVGPIYLESSLDPNGLYEFDAAKGTWKPLPVFPAQRRTEVGLFSIGDTIYTLTGGFLFQGTTCPPATLTGFHKYSIGSSKWQAASSFPPFQTRLAAMAFSVNGRGYFGGGKIFVYDTLQPPDCPFREVYLTDFWEYTPATGKWREMPSLPYRLVNDPQTRVGGRAKAVVFADNQYGYMGGGVLEFQYLRDFWRFVPPANDADPGRWEFVNYLPDPTRTGASGFVVGSKAYFGFGVNAFLGYRSDFWELDLSKPGSVWKSRKPCPGPHRSDAFAFGLNGKGYVGTGNDRLWDGFQASLLVYSDFWEYTPEQ
jgi:hypothetical protein